VLVSHPLHRKFCVSLEIVLIGWRKKSEARQGKVVELYRRVEWVWTVATKPLSTKGPSARAVF
jgi:hypothetical protein